MKLHRLKKSIKLKLLDRLLKGNNVTCNICGRSYTTFIPYLGRINAQCPNCGSLERTRLIYRFITDLKLVNADTRLLHIAPEKSFFELFSKKLGANYTAVDKFETGYTYPKGTLHADITALPFADESFDALICIHVLEHVPDDAKALSELFRVLKKGGFAIVQVPYEPERLTTYEDPAVVTPEERKKHFLQSDHVRIYGRDFIQRFIKPGFKITHADYSSGLDSSIREKLALKNEEIFLLRK